jgi:hypothetical protein
VPEFYAPKAVPMMMESIIAAVIQGDGGKVRAHWRPQMRAFVSAFGRDDTCHPLLHAAHRLHVDIVRFLLDEGISPRIRGTVHPYTGDCMTVSELQGERRRGRWVGETAAVCARARIRLLRLRPSHGAARGSSRPPHAHVG